MADPMTLALVGAGAGAIMSPRDPLKGAIIGAVGGYTGGTALGAGAPAGGIVGGTGLTATSATGAGLGTNLAAGSAAPGLGLKAAASTAAAPTAQFATAAVPTAASVGGVAGSTGAYLTPTMFDRGVAADLAAAKQAENLKKLEYGQKAMSMFNQQQPQPTAMSPQQMKRGQVNSAEPILGLLGDYGPMSIERRKRMSLLG